MRIGRNEPCPCGSGKRHKNCCLGKDSVATAPPPFVLAALQQVTELLTSGQTDRLVQIGDDLTALLGYGELAWVRIAPDEFEDAVRDALLETSNVDDDKIASHVRAAFERFATVDALVALQKDLVAELPNPAHSAADRRAIALAVLLNGPAGTPTPAAGNDFVDLLFDVQMQEALVALNTQDVLSDAIDAAVERAVAGVPEAAVEATSYSISRTIERLHSDPPVPVLTADELLLATVAPGAEILQKVFVTVAPHEDDVGRPATIRAFEVLVQEIERELGAEGLDTIRNRANAASVAAPGDAAATDLAKAAAIAPGLLAAAAVIAPGLSTLWRSDEEPVSPARYSTPSSSPRQFRAICRPPPQERPRRRRAPRRARRRPPRKDQAPRVGREPARAHRHLRADHPAVRVRALFRDPHLPFPDRGLLLGHRAETEGETGGGSGEAAPKAQQAQLKWRSAFTSAGDRASETTTRRPIPATRDRPILRR